MNKIKRTLYCFMNKHFEFVDKWGNVTDDLKEAKGFEKLEDAKRERETFDEPEEWKIVKKNIVFTLEEIVEE